MDQIRAALVWLKRHHFWVLTAVVTFTALGCWYTAANDLSQRYEESKRQIETEFNDVQSLNNRPFFPNDEVNEEQRKQNQKQREEVEALWQQLYEAQQAAVLKWPDSLTPRFHREIVKLKFGDDIYSELRNEYQNYAKEHFSELPKIVKAIELPPTAGGGGGRGGGSRGGTGSTFDMDRFEEMLAEGQLPGFRNMGDESEAPKLTEFLVYWADQNKIREQLIFSRRPSSLRIWTTQEDLWVYTTLLQIIAETNEAAGATRFSNAAIRVIESLDVGQDAARESRGQDRILMREMTSGRGGGEGDPYERGGGRGGDMDMDYDGRGGSTDEYGGRGGEGEGDEGTELLSQRYLDDDGKPLAVSTGWSPKDFGTEYKRLPIRMMLQVDQRWLYHLIATCANAPLQIEVQEVRIRPLVGASSGRGAGRTQRMYDLQTGGRSMGLSAASGRGGRSLANVNFFDRQPYVVPVIIQGTIYIFNEPDPDELQIDDGSA